MSAADLAEAVQELLREVRLLKKAQQKPPRQAWKPSEVADKLGLEYETVLGLIHDEQLGAIEINGRYLVPEAELQRLLAPGVKTA